MKRLGLAALVFLVSLPVLAASDLIILNATSKPVTAEVGTQYALLFDVKNQGDAAAPAPAVKVPLPAGGTFVSCAASNGSVQGVAYTGYAICRSIAGTSLAPGAVLPIAVKMKAPLAQSSFTATLQADPDNLVAESNEANNTAPVSTSFQAYVRAAVFASLCPASATIGSLYSLQLGIKNTGSLDIRYPGFNVRVTATDANGAASPVTLASIDPRGGTITPLPIGSASTVGLAQNVHQFAYTPAYPAYIPLTPGTAVPLNLNLRSAVAQTVTVRGWIDTQAIQDTTSPADNQVTCTISVR